MPMKRYSQGVSSAGVLLIILVAMGNTVEVLGRTVAAPKGRKANVLERVFRLEAMKRCRGFTCKGPQNRTYHILDLLHEQGHIPPASFPTITPAYLVVQRCDGHAGCCESPALTCLPKTHAQEEIEIFKQEVQGPKQFVRITVEQHTSCECRSANKTYRDQLELLKPNISLYDDSNS
ncbi:uncharacterized protein LOC107039997 [Diachasma alloeum]|uniref:uncharacterized protein LOC107039997 n=1 Tax=Diachasma alloeum TaxID=454923 RepID=UPI0007384F6E|nr:uncharacterized protein LOC107039997 [Diachasma alloeum]